MNTAEILEKCQTLPGVTVHMQPNCAELRLSTDGGTGRMCFLPLFPGITLALIEVHAPSWPAPEPDRPTPDAKGPLIVNYCIRGRCELVLNDSRSVFLTSGQISLTERFAQNAYVYPGRLYEGVELFIDPEVSAAGLPLLRDHFDLDLTALGRRYCPQGGTFIAPMSLPDHLLERLWTPSGPENPLCAAGRKTAVLDLLALLLHGSPQPQAAPLTYFTKSQIEITRRIEAMISADLSRPRTVGELARQFAVSESSVKNYFRGVYGQSIAQYLQQRRMEQAAALLSSTRLPVVEVAAQVGYESQSKFSAAFRRKYGSTPLEYRRARNLPAQNAENRLEAP